MSTAGTVADDVTVEALTADPFPIYAELRRNAPVCYLPAVDLWFVTRWPDVIAASEDPTHFPASMPDSPLDRTLGGANVLTVDADEHARMRDPMETTLRPKAVEERAPEIVHRIADQLIDGFAERGEAELMNAFCEPFSVLTLAEMIGLRGLDAATLQRWFHELATGTSNYEGDAAKQAIADRVNEEIDDTLRPLFAELMKRPDGTMVSDMLHAEEGDPDERVRGFLPSLKLALIGGLQEPGHGMGSTVVGLLQNPDQADALKRDMNALLKRAVDEGLRWISPIGTQGRASANGATLQGVEIPDGANVALMVQSANRDEDEWGPTAGRFDLFRERHPHAAFGFGPHFCVGHYLARWQVRTGIRRLFERLPSLRLDGDVRFSGWEYRGPSHLPVRWNA